MDIEHKKAIGMAFLVHAQRQRPDAGYEFVMIRDSRKDEFAREWPFTVSFARVSCHGAGEVYFITEDRTIYTVNGLAMSARTNDPHGRAIWKDAPAGTPGGGKVSMHRVIRTGLELCR